MPPAESLLGDVTCITCSVVLVLLVGKVVWYTVVELAWAPATVDLFVQAIVQGIVVLVVGYFNWKVYRVGARRHAHARQSTRVFHYS